MGLRSTPPKPDGLGDGEWRPLKGKQEWCFQNVGEPILRTKKKFLLAISHLLVTEGPEWGRKAHWHPLTPTETLPWTWRPDSCCPLGTLCPAGASRELRKKTALPQLYRPAEGRQTDGGTPECLLPSHRKSCERGNSTHPLNNNNKKTNKNPKTKKPPQTKSSVFEIF